MRQRRGKGSRSTNLQATSHQQSSYNQTALASNNYDKKPRMVRMMRKMSRRMMMRMGRLMGNMSRKRRTTKRRRRRMEEEDGGWRGE